jgi:hypothetical protein
VPDGNSTTTTFSASVDLPSNTVSHALPLQVLGNWVGASYDTPAAPDEDVLTGFLCNVVSTSDNYDVSAPAYETQFRIVMPEISERWRDPLSISTPITASISIASGDLVITF